jgi:putative ABC transport system ATP-binding protein
MAGIELSVPRGRFVAIMGRSGSGKSTLLRCAAGIERTTSGTVRLAGHELTALSDTRRTLVRRDHAAFIFQDYTLLPTLDVWDNIAAPFILADRPVPRERLGRLLATLGLADRARERPQRLSGGEQQRVAIARALAVDADVIFADEPTGALDGQTGRTVLGQLRRVVDAQRSVVMVTHDPLAASFADEAVILADGRITDRITEPSASRLTAALGSVDPGAA